MNDAIAVLNAGSSSLKFSLYSLDNDQLKVESRGQIEGVGTKPRFKAKDLAGEVLADLDLKYSGQEFGHSEAFAYLAQWIRDHYRQSLAPLGVGHRVVHGGMDFAGPTLIDDGVVKKLEELIPLAPLHQPHNVAAVKGVTKLNPGLPQVACFDTSFHRGRAEVTERFGLPDRFFRQGLRRWGFHGLSYESIVDKLRRMAPELAQGRLVVAHLGSGASLCGIKNGRSVDTTMSFSVLDGLPMGTRCGNLDPGAVLFLLQRMSPKQLEDLLYKESGLLGISGVSNDVRALLASDNPMAAEALEFFVYRITREIGSLTAALGGLDALIFTAGVGENSPVIRQRVCQGLGWLGIHISDELNQGNRECITPKGATPSVWAIPTDEEGVIAAHTLKVVTESKSK